MVDSLRGASIAVGVFQRDIQARRTAEGADDKKAQVDIRSL